MWPRCWDWRYRRPASDTSGHSSGFKSRSRMFPVCSTASADRTALLRITNIGNKTMPVSSSEQPLIEDLAEEFLERRRRGERPSLQEYAARYPELAGEIREFFPVLGLVEDFKPDTGDVTGSIAGSSIPGIGTLLERLGDF